MGSTNIASPPPPPVPVDAGKASLDYINSMSDPALQSRLLASEQEFRPKYNELNLKDLSQYLIGSSGTPGALAQLNAASLSAANTQAEANTIQRQRDIQDVNTLGGQATQAFRNANPELQAQLLAAQGLSRSGSPYGSLEAAILGNRQQGATPQGPLGDMIYQQALQANGLGLVGQTLQGRAQALAQSTGAMTVDELRAMQQDIRGAYAARGTEMSNGAITAEALGRLTNERQNMQNDLMMASGLNQSNQAELGANRSFQGNVYGANAAMQAANRQYYDQFAQQNIQNMGLLGQARGNQLAQDRTYALQLAQMQAAIAADPFQAILGRQSGALQYGAGQQGFAGGLTQGMQGPQLFDPNTGINLGLQNAGNLGNYQAATYGAQANAQGQRAGAVYGMIGKIGGSLLGNPMFPFPS